MKLTLYDFLVFFQWGCMVASAIFSMRLMGNKEIPPYMNKFYWYSLIVGTISIYSFLHKYFSITNLYVYNLIQILLLLFHFIFLSLFIYRVLPNKNIPILKPLFFFFIMVILLCIVKNDSSKPQITAYVFSNLGLVIFCCFYYLQIFEEMPTLNLLKEASFWVLTGIFFGMCATIPINSLRDYLFHNIPHNLFLSMGSIGFFAFGVMHLFFIKAYLCSTSPPKA